MKNWGQDFGYCFAEEPIEDEQPEEDSQLFWFQNKATRRILFENAKDVNEAFIAILRYAHDTEVYNWVCLDVKSNEVELDYQTAFKAMRGIGEYGKNKQQTRPQAWNN